MFEETGREQDRGLSGLVFGQGSIQLVHFRFFHRGRHSKVGRTGNDGVSERSREGLLKAHSGKMVALVHNDVPVVARLPTKSVPW